ncbi:MAG: sulfite exporter TauE/SafE family protein [Methanophagales archaeon]|nr:sulfite exporter TauE/SafE family protein [Methanophagales archaeon]
MLIEYMPQSTLIIIYICIGLFAGFMSGMFGIGGGAVRIPLLNLAGLPLLSAFGINLFIVPFSSLVGAVSQRENIDKEIVIYLGVGGVFGALIGAFLTGLIPTLILAVIFVALSLVIVLGLFLDRIVPALAHKINLTHKSAFASSFFLSLMAAIRGGSAGSLFPAFLKATGCDIHRAIATSLCVTIFTCIGAAIIFWSRGDIIWLPAIFALTGSMVGARVGSAVSLKTKSIWLEIGLGILVVALALITVYKAL